MTDEEREDLNTFKHDLVKQARWWQWKAETLEKENEQLKSENAALKERLEKAVELPPGDRVWYIAEDEEGAESYIISKPTSSLAVEELKYEIGKKYFTTREAAEKRAELNGGKQ